MMLKCFMFYSISNIYKSISITVIMLLVFSVYVNTFEAELTPRKVFVSLSLITFVRLTSVHFFILTINALTNARVSWIRIRVSLRYYHATILCFYLLEFTPIK